MNERRCGECNQLLPATPEPGEALIHHHHCSQYPLMQWERKKALLLAAAIVWNEGTNGTKDSVAIVAKLLSEIETRLQPAALAEANR